MATAIAFNGISVPQAIALPRKLSADEKLTVELFNRNTPSVVNVTNLATRQDAFTLDMTAFPQGSGSGFLWDSDGHVVTNLHVIDSAQDLVV
eukprot:CAMPEP_0177609920 /NCGR_PEP_ID=MMETSP0419_2-20121207/19424_1 /TAXON_ID=582737 /ORGANISM="Tetraselmis sp., Strain GSL018" /LENGTH=91 /DNA_ID=CAMNT_0019105033 /DNA_START=348 /DNA_END=619 /DNA_ORIENTATION=-